MKSYAKLLSCGFVLPLSFLVGNCVAGEPSPNEQLWLQLINRFRTDPVGELDRLVDYEEPETNTVDGLTTESY